MKPRLIVEFPLSTLPIDQRYRQATSRVQCVGLLTTKLRKQLDCEVTLRPTDESTFRILAPERPYIELHEIEDIDQALTDAIARLERWRLDAVWSVTWSYPATADERERTGFATWDEFRVEFHARYQIEGSIMLVQVATADRQLLRRYRCQTPFERPNEYAIDRALDQAALAWLERFGYQCLK